MNLGEHIYRLRTQKNLSQGDLANALDVSRQSVSKWENNSAVPELDKLIKIAEIFEITLDELVTGKDAVEPPQPDPNVLYIENSTRPTVTAMQILGILLLFCCALVICFSFLFEDLRDLEDCLPLCLPVALCGIFCLVSKKPGLWCSWIVAFGYWLYIFVLSARWEHQPLLLALGILLIGITFGYTLTLHKRNEIHIKPWVWAVLITTLTILGFLLLINLIPPDQGTVYPAEPIPAG